jgi:protein ImuB
VLTASSRFLAACLPAFRLERCGWAANDLVVLVAEERNAVRVVARTPAAAASGIEEGMPLVEARAIVVALAVEWLDPEAEAADREALRLAVAARLSDRVAYARPDTLVLEVAGVAHLFGDERALLVAARALFVSLGHAASVVIADHPGAAVAFARFAPDSAGDGVFPSGRAATSSCLAPLPVVCLEPSYELLRSLRALGVDTVGALARLDRAGVAGRYGAEGVALHRLACGAPVSTRPWEPEVADSPVVARVVLGGPTASAEPILFVLPGLLRTVLAELHTRCRSAVRVVLRLFVEDGPPKVLSVHAGRPTRDHDALSRLLRARLEGVRLPSPAIEVVIEVEEHVPEVPWAPSWMDRTTGVEALPDLLARLVDALGADAVVVPELVDAWRPEAAWRAADHALPSSTPAVRGARARRRDPVEPIDRWDAEIARIRPVVLLPRPVPVEVRTEHGAPVALRDRGQGWRALTDPSGPERLQGGWWSDEASFDRDYWRVTLDGGVAWLYREGGAWLLHGYF